MKKFIIVSFSIFLLSACNMQGVNNTVPAADMPNGVPDDSSSEVADTAEAADTAAKVEDTAPAEQVFEDSIDLTGTWEGVLSHVLVSGFCPQTPTQQGTVLIQQDGGIFTMQFTDGFDCRPESACDFTGVANADTFTASNRGVADSEGGRYTTSLTMTALSEDLVEGTGNSTYTHPEMQCEWTTSLSLTR